VDNCPEGKGGEMQRGRRQFTLQWLMWLVAVIGFEAFLFRMIYKINAKRTSPFTFIVTHFMGGSVMFGFLFSRIRPAASIPSGHGEQRSDSGPPYPSSD
jgi:hypothetical protein